MITILSPILDQLNKWMDEIPTEKLLDGKNRFMLSAYTNGRKPPKLKQHLRQHDGKHILISLPQSLPL